MSQFHVVNESTEDTFEGTDHLQDAIRVAREVAGRGPAGDLITILDSGGLAIRQFVRMGDGTVAEQAIARRVEVCGDDPERNRAEPLYGL